MKRTLLLCAAALVALALLLHFAHAHDQFSHWLSPYGVKCCSDLEKECRAVRSDYDVSAGRYVILVGGRWVPVPAEAVLTKQESPDGSSYACIGKTGTIFCFVNGKAKI